MLTFKFLIFFTFLMIEGLAFLFVQILGQDRRDCDITEDCHET